MAWKIVRRILVATIVALFVVPPVSAEIPKSNNYSFDESSIGTGGMLQSNSTNYTATDATGDFVNGTSASANYNVLSGSRTGADPVLSFKILTTANSFGNFSPTATAVANASFSVKNYTSYGYVVQVTGPPPTHSGRALAAMNIAGSAQPGVEQFGINLVANTLPTSFGANLVNGDFGHGIVQPNYNTPNMFYYQDGDTIARADKESGETTYTISYIINVAALTPGGQYTAAQTLIVTGTY